MKLVSFSVTLALLIKFLRAIEDLNLKGLIEGLGSGSIEVVEDLSSVEAVEGLGILSSEASPEASPEALILDLINLL